MAEETKKSAQIFRLTKSGSMRKQVLKDLGPTNISSSTSARRATKALSSRRSISASSTG
jgi:hypothetical protein